MTVTASADLREHVAAVVRGLPDAAVFLDHVFCPVCCNTPFVSMTGLRARVVEQHIRDGKQPLELLGRQDGRDLAVARDVMDSGKPMRLDEITVRNSGGETFNVIASYIPVGGVHGVAGVVVCYRDVTSEARMQERYKEFMAAEKARAEDLERQVAERTQELEVALAEVKVLSSTDPLTSLLNRRAFTEAAERALLVATRHNRNTAVLMCDLDHFKLLNDTFGHQVGDAVLVGVAKYLTKTVRQTDCVGRYGGEEFIILLTEISPETVGVVSERCCNAIRNMPLAEIDPQLRAPITISIGVAIYPQDATELQVLIACADKALYQAKEMGRDRVVTFTPDAGGLAPIQAAAGQEPMSVLLVGNDAEALRGVLPSAYDVTTAVEPATARDLCQRRIVDVIVSDEELSGCSGVDLLLEMLDVQPGSLKILLIGSEDGYVAVRGTNLARVDLFLLRSEARQNLAKAIADGLAQREVRREAVRRRRRLRAAAPGQDEASDLDELIAREQLSMVYQPIVEVFSGAVVAYEALCRPSAPAFPNPTILFDAAVRAGRVWRLSRLVRRLAVQPMPALGEGRLLFVNLHPSDVDDPELLEGEPALLPWIGRIVFEITERASIPATGRFIDNVRQLGSLGFRFAIDNLGAGYASLNSIVLLNPSFIKIDMFLTRGIEIDSPRAKLVRRIAEFANDAGLKVVAEGVETAEELEAVAALGCHLAQGYFFAHPAPPFVEAGANGFAARGSKGVL